MCFILAQPSHVYYFVSTLIPLYPHLSRICICLKRFIQVFGCFLHFLYIRYQKKSKKICNIKLNNYLCIRNKTTKQQKHYGN